MNDDDPQLEFVTLPLYEDDIEAMVLLQSDRITLVPQGDETESEICCPIDV